MSEYTKILEDNKIIQGTRITLRPFLLSDAEAMYKYAGDDEVTKYLSFDTHKNIEESKETLENFFVDKPGIYAIENNETKEVMGCIDIRVTERGRASFGYVLARQYWGKGYMTEALKMIFELAFNEMNLDAVYAVHYLENPASGRVMEKAGMQYVGILNNGFVGHDHKTWDCKLYNITKEDYQFQQTAETTLDLLRYEINNLDANLVTLLERRFAVTQKVGEYKKGIGMDVLDSGREKVVLEKVASLIQNDVNKKEILAIFDALLVQSKNQQKEVIIDE